MLCSSVVILILSTLAAYVSCDASRHTDVVLLGATGDLAKKYLWQGLFNLYQQEVNHGHTFSFYGCARSFSDDDGATVLKNILQSSIDCAEQDAECIKLKETLIALTHYKQLKSEVHYQELSKVLRASEENESVNGRNYLRIFYLSIPPFSYVQTSQYISLHCRPASAESSLRVVFEKPFGHDLGSAVHLADQLADFFTDEEIYRIDHYIGKSVVQEILPFRSNEHVKKMWNRHHISRVDVVMKEEADVKGRTAYYDEYGVIRDVIQNHLMELLILVAMEMPSDVNNSTALQQNKLALLNHVTDISEESALLGQYEIYQGEVQQQNPSKTTTNTPTFAAIMAFVDTPRWNGVPFLCMSGKKLAARQSYIKVYLRDNDYSLDGFTTSAKQNREIIFKIGDNYKNSPSIMISNGLAESLELEEHFEVTRGHDYHIIHPSHNKDAYSNLITALFHAHRDQFISKEHLIKSWEIWSPLVTKLATKSVIVYEGAKKSAEKLQFKIEGRSLKFIVNHGLGTVSLEGDSVPETFLDNELVVLPMESDEQTLLDKLEDDMFHIAQRAVEARGVFHIAFSGGSTPQKLFRKLAHSVRPFPWKHTHVWIVDERCVPYTDAASNFKSLWENLLTWVSIPYWNIHPMPVDNHSGLCIPWEDRDYAAQIQRLVPDSRFDLVLLGLGSDGHTASIFPGETRKALEMENLVFYANKTSVKRMSISYEVINHSRHVGVLVTGKGKFNILREIKGETDVDKYPIVGVKPEEGKLVWYIDTSAWSGE